MQHIFTLKLRDFTRVRVHSANSTHGLKHLEALLEIDLAEHSLIFVVEVSALRVQLEYSNGAIKKTFFYWIPRNLSNQLSVKTIKTTTWQNTYLMTTCR